MSPRGRVVEYPRTMATDGIAFDRRRAIRTALAIRVDSPAVSGQYLGTHHHHAQEGTGTKIVTPKQSSTAPLDKSAGGMRTADQAR